MKEKGSGVAIETKWRGRANAQIDFCIHHWLVRQKREKKSLQQQNHVQGEHSTTKELKKKISDEHW